MVVLFMITPISKCNYGRKLLPGDYHIYLYLYIYIYGIYQNIKGIKILHLISQL